jgi:arylsulfatase A-like enzyme
MNVIWIFGDQHRAQSLGCAGAPNLHTPNLDRMASDGVYFRRAVMGFPLCCPCRGSLLTGEYPHRAVSGHEVPLPEGMPTLGNHLGDAGVDTAWFGKWHVDGHHEGEGRGALHVIPRERRGGFDTWVGYENNNAQFDCWVHGHDGDAEVPLTPLDGYETDALTDRLLEWIGRGERNGKPFFAALSVQPPHDPYVAPPEWMGRHSPEEMELRPNVPAIPAVEEKARRQLAGYNAMIENLDWNVGRVLEAVRKSPFRDDTAILFFSDHGDMQGSHGRWGKTNPHEESIRVPMIFWSSQNHHYAPYAMTETDQLINHVDLLPTTLGLCGVEVPAHLPGTDFSSSLVKRKHPENAPKSAFLQNVVPTGHTNSDGIPWRGVVTEDGWKYAAFADAPYMLYNLNEDPYEQVNLITQPHLKAKRLELQELLEAWIRKTGDDFPVWKG